MAQSTRYYYDAGNSASSKTIDWNNGEIQKMSMVASISTLTLSNPLSKGITYILELVQDGTGGWTITWPGSVTWVSGSAPTLGGANKTDIIYLYWNGTGYIGSVAGVGGSSGSSGIAGTSGSSGSTGSSGSAGTSGIDGYTCFSYTISDGAFGGAFDYIDCTDPTGFPNTYLLTTGQSVTLCAVMNSINVTSGTLIVTPNGICSGSSGSSGTSGSRGTSGTSGTSGSSGSSGSSGTSGSRGTSGSSGSSGQSVSLIGTANIVPKYDGSSTIEETTYYIKEDTTNDAILFGDKATACREHDLVQSKVTFDDDVVGTIRTTESVLKLVTDGQASYGQSIPMYLDDNGSAYFKIQTNHIVTFSILFQISDNFSCNPYESMFGAHHSRRIEGTVINLGGAASIVTPVTHTTLSTYIMDTSAFDVIVSTNTDELWVSVLQNITNASTYTLRATAFVRTIDHKMDTTLDNSDTAWPGWCNY